MIELKPRHRRLLVLGITEQWAFAAGTLLLALRRHNPKLDADLLLFHDGKLNNADALIFKKLDVKLQTFEAQTNCLSQELLALYSPLCLAKFCCFELLKYYESVAWLDADIIIQDNLEDLWSYGPFSLACEDVFFYEDQKPRGADINGTIPLPDLDRNRPNLNSGVFVLNYALPNPEALAKQGLNYLAKHKSEIRFADQAAFNMLAKVIASSDAKLWQELPNHFNCHPKNPAALYAPIVHAFGAYKLWNDGLSQACFPEWQRDYARWLKLGGSPWQGEINNANYLQKSPFNLLTSFYNTMEASEKALQQLGKQLEVEQAKNRQLKQLVQNLTNKLS